MNETTIIKVTLADIAELQSICRKTFFDTYSSQNTAEDMQKYLDENFSTQTLKKELNNPNSAFYFAFFNNETIGFLKINFGLSQTEVKDDTSVEIERIYVAQDFQGKKIGKFLFDKALEVASDRKAKYVWLGVWEENLRAINFYKKHGFIKFDKHVFNLGNDEQTDFMMKLEL